MLIALGQRRSLPASLISSSLLFLFASATYAGARETLQPDEVAIIAMRDSRESRAVAGHYARRRGIPNERICLLPGDESHGIGRREWQQQLRPYLRRWLVQNRLEAQIRCFVVCWGVPLKIGRRDEDDPEVRQRTDYLAIRRADLQREIGELLVEIGSLSDTAEPSLGEMNIEQIRALVEEALEERWRPLLGGQPSDERRQRRVELSQLTLRAFGTEPLGKEDVPRWPIPAAIERAQQQGYSAGLRRGLYLMLQLPDTMVRDEKALEALEDLFGLVGCLEWIEKELKLLDGNETSASFDSELSLLYWPPYAPLRWQDNLLHHRYDGSPLRQRRTTLMVARLEAPTVALAQRMVDDAIAAEKDGLEGNFYVDARGLSGTGGTVRYDQSLHRLAKLIKEETDMEVVLDNEPQVFGQDQCPDAALYCGWYALANYVDAFTWSRGAVGYHLASLEAETLRSGPGRPWCRAMIEDGAAATLGPAFEPYLQAFPDPTEFFVLFLSGRYTLAECYYRTKKQNSWAMVLVGDPLYNPFESRPAIDPERLPADLERLFQEDVRVDVETRIRQRIRAVDAP